MMMVLRRSGRSLTALTLLLACVAFPAVADRFLDWPEYQVNDDVTGQEFQGDIDAAVQPDGSWCAAWLDYRMGYPAIFVRCFSASNVPVGESVPVTDGIGLFSVELNPAPIGEPALAPIGDGRSVLVWADGRLLPDGRSAIRAAIVGPAGILAGPVTVNNPERPNIRSEPRIAIVQGMACITWTEGSSFSNVYAQVLDLDGLTRMHPDDFLIDPDGMQSQLGCRIVSRAGGWIVAWQGAVSPTRNRIFVRTLASDGTPTGIPTQVDPSSDWNQITPALVRLETAYLVTWVGQFESRTRLIARTLGTDLNPVAPAFDVVDEGATVTPRSPECLATGSERAIVVWVAGNASRTRFYARNVDLPSSPSGPFVTIDDPEDPIGGVLIPRNLALRGGEGSDIRVLWTDNREGYDLDYQLRIDSEGNPLEEPNPLDLAPGSASQLLPAVSFFTDGGAFVAWEDFRTGGLTIYGRLLDGEGRPQGASFRISESSSGSVTVPATGLRDLRRNQPAVVTTSDGRVVVAWTLILPGGQTTIVVQHYDRSGHAIGSNVPIAEAGGVNSPQLAALNDGRYWLVWCDKRRDSDGDIVARRFFSDGTEAGDTIRVVDPGSSSAPQFSPAIAASPEAGELVITWIDGRRSQVDPPFPNSDVFAQRIAANGHKIETNMQINSLEGEAAVPQHNPAIAAAPNGYVLVWDDNPLLNPDVVGAAVFLPSLKNGKMTAEPPVYFTIPTHSPGFKYPRVAMDPQGQFVVTYWDTEADSARVMAQRFNASAEPVGSSYPLMGINGQVAALPADVAVQLDQIQFAYADGRGRTGWDVHVRRVNWAFEGEYSPVLVMDHSVEEDGDGLVIRWSVPLDAAGTPYTVWRGNADQATEHPDPAARVVSSEPVGPISFGGSDYLFRDSTADPAHPYAYWIEGPTGDFAGPWFGMIGRGAPLTLRATRNPFRESVRLSWSAPGAARVSLSLYDVSGRRVRTLFAGPPGSGSGTNESRGTARGDAVWDGKDQSGRLVPAGLYWARLESQPGGEKIVRILRLR
jgi:hypothetical protein